MERKKYTRKTEETPAILKFREKRRWQIALRRYVIEKNTSVNYAPYFGLDIENMRKWFQMQFTQDLNWDNFAKAWQFDHIVPVTYFNFKDETELRLCWNFTNIRVETIQKNKDRGNRVDVLMAKNYFQDLYNQTKYKICSDLFDKISSIEVSDIISTEAQTQFILQNKEYLEYVENFSNYEFELLNLGRSIADVTKEANFLKTVNG